MVRGCNLVTLLALHSGDVDLTHWVPRLLANLYNGHLYIWNTNDQSLVKSFEVTELPGDLPGSHSIHVMLLNLLSSCCLLQSPTLFGAVCQHLSQTLCI